MRVLFDQGTPVPLRESLGEIYYMVEDDFELWLLNARHLKNVPARKTDVKDAEWICQLVEHGLVRPNFVPPKEIRELRNLTRYRKA